MTESGRSRPPGPGLDPGCLSPETLAAYIDGTLADAERAGVEVHLAGCADCYELLVESARFQQSDAPPIAKVIPFRRRALIIAAGALLAAATLMLAVRVAAPLWWERYVRGNPRPELAELVAAIGESRPIEARLSGGFAFGPLVSGRRGGQPADGATAPAVRIAAAKLEQLAASRNTPATVAAFGVASLALGDAGRAVTLLEEAAMSAPNDGGIQADLAAAYLARSEDEVHTEDLPRALAAADRAIRINPTVEALFNRALALERLRLRTEADRAWEAYLARDPASPWAGEARRYLQAGRAGASSPNRAREALAALSPDDSASIARVVSAFPQEAREYVENTLLPAWAGEAFAAAGNADGTLTRAEAIATRLADTTGDRLALDATMVVRRAAGASPRVLSRGHQAYRTALRHFDAFSYKEARPVFEEARAAFAAERSPFRYWCDLHLAILADSRKERESAHARLDALLSEVPEEYRTLRARAHWIRGLVRTNMARFDGAMDDELAARAIYESIGEQRNIAWMENLIAELYRQLGESDLAWRYRAAALARVDRRASTRVLQSLLLGAARSARDEGLLPASMYFDSEADVLARQDRPAACAQVEVRRIATLRELGQLALTREAIDQTKKCLDQVDDKELSASLGAELNAEEGLMAAQADPNTAVQSLSQAIEYSEAAPALSMLPRLYLERGRLHRRLGETDAARRDFEAGIEMFERNRHAAGDDALRVSFFDESWRLFDELIALQAIDRGEHDAALEVAERRRRNAFQSKPVAAMNRPRLPSGVVVLYFAALPDRLLTWVIDSQSTAFVDRPVSAARLELLVMQLQRAHEGGIRARTLEAAANLYDEVIRPVATHLPDEARLVIVPDGALHRVPFAELYDRSQPAFLIEHHAVTLAPSLATGSSAVAKRFAATRTLVVTPPASLVEGLRPLTYAVEEGHRIARGYPGASTIDGPAATVDAIVARMQRQDIVHFAGHAVANPDNPGLSRLLLAPAVPNGSPARLTADRVAHMNLSRTSLVVLAACSTASGRISRGQGVLGLTRAFLDAGVASVVATLWDVNDRTSSALFSTFHDRLRASGDVAIALREAQISLLKSSDPSLRDPASWAGVVHHARIDAAR